MLDYEHYSQPWEHEDFAAKGGEENLLDAVETLGLPRVLQKKHEKYRSHLLARTRIDQHARLFNWHRAMQKNERRVADDLKTLSELEKRAKQRRDDLIAMVRCHGDLSEFAQQLFDTGPIKGVLRDTPLSWPLFDTNDEAIAERATTTKAELLRRFGPDKGGNVNVFTHRIGSAQVALVWRCWATFTKFHPERPKGEPFSDFCTSTYQYATAEEGFPSIDHVIKEVSARRQGPGRVAVRPIEEHFTGPMVRPLDDDETDEPLTAPWLGAPRDGQRNR